LKRDLNRESRVSSIEYRAASSYIADAMKRILLSFLLACFAVAPAIANACAGGCESSSSASAHHAADADAGSTALDILDCHGASSAGNVPDDTTMPDGVPMASACLVAAAASMPAPMFSALILEIDTQRYSAVLLLPASFEATPPIKPPKA
jgi:hypothetical protein